MIFKKKLFTILIFFFFFLFLKSLKYVLEYLLKKRRRKREVCVGSFQNADIMARLCGGNWRLLGNILPSQSSSTTPYPRTEFLCWRGWKGRKARGLARRSSWARRLVLQPLYYVDKKKEKRKISLMFYDKLFQMKKYTYKYILLLKIKQ